MKLQFGLETTIKTKRFVANIVATKTGHNTTVSDIIITEQGQLWIKQ